jgi:hypothetical protein
MQQSWIRSHYVHNLPWLALLLSLLQGWGAGTDTINTAVIDNLAPNTTYFYKFGSQVRNCGNVAVCGRSTHKTSIYHFPCALPAELKRKKSTQSSRLVSAAGVRHIGIHVLPWHHFTGCTILLLTRVPQPF